MIEDFAARVNISTKKHRNQNVTLKGRGSPVSRLCMLCVLEWPRRQFINAKIRQQLFSVIK